MSQHEPRRSPAGHAIFLVIFAALFAGGLVVTFLAAPLLALTPLQWVVALVLTVVTGAATAWEVRCLVAALRHSKRSRPS
ncbi:hypothetical protein [Microbacterium sp. Leaf151]|jgi:hypothetical protein|uniref:hypothetical protein n=1 Tax=Microbacterium sp. Leaf151 TaxID=1736276 RepID=UPI0006F68B00|nr:hypothetical protein [Microbacterium sp. Leaf151]KQR24903.1 hypothetical protein ASF76_04290 [Microbacterium sp. Leaf151]